VFVLLRILVGVLIGRVFFVFHGVHDLHFQASDTKLN
jgi:hypothetical protein